MASKKTSKKKIVGLCEAHNQLDKMIKSNERKAAILIDDLTDQLREYEVRIVSESKKFFGLTQ